jgi:hypothetical protein
MREDGWRNVRMRCRSDLLVATTKKEEEEEEEEE